MLRPLFALLLALTLASCTTTQNFTAAAGDIPDGAKILIVEPDVQLSLLTASGMQEPNADWSAAGATNLRTQLEKAFDTKGVAFATTPPDALREGCGAQLLRLNEVVLDSILTFEVGPYKLPTKQAGFDWTLGEGAVELGRNFNADYALFTLARGSYSSGGRVAATIALAMVGVGLPSGGQAVRVALVELKTGRVVWFNVAIAGPNDMREAAGAQALVAAVLKGMPL